MTVHKAAHICKVLIDCNVENLEISGKAITMSKLVILHFSKLNSHLTWKSCRVLAIVNYILALDSITCSN